MKLGNITKWLQLLALVAFGTILMLCYYAIEPFGQTTTAYTTASTTIYPGLNYTSVANVFTSPFNIMSFFVFILMLLAFGITYMRSQSIVFGFFSSMLLSFVVVALFLAAGATPSQSAPVLAASGIATVGFIAISFYEIYSKK